MHDMDPFERRLAGALRVDADQHVARFDPAAVARAAIAGTARRSVGVPWNISTLPMLARVAAAAVVGVLAVGGAFLLTQHGLPAAVGGPSTAPIPSEPASPSAGPSSSGVRTGARDWWPTGRPGTGRIGATATLLADGKVLLADGAQITGIMSARALATAELYDPASGSWIGTGTAGVPRYGATATLLDDGRVLVVGGTESTDSTSPELGTLASAELYDPATGTWTATASMHAPRWGHTATRLLDGKVLVTGGVTSFKVGALASAELYDPASGTWTPVADMGQRRERHVATLLPEGSVLVVGGTSGDGYPLSSAELYDPTTGIWTATGAMATGREGFSGTLLQDGTVLVAGGPNNRAAELYDPRSGAWTATGSMTQLHQYGTDVETSPTATLLLDGRVLLVGGGGKDADLYDPASGTWTSTDSMVTGRVGNTATLLRDGTVLVAGGGQAEGGTIDQFYDPAAEVYVPRGTK